MPDNSTGSGILRRFGDGPLAYLFILCLAFAAHFLQFRAFGLYEDDYWSVARNYEITWQELREQARYCFTIWPQGRPLNHLLPHVLTFVGARLGGIEAMYAIGALWLALNGWLGYRLARTWLSAPAAMATAMAYILYPSDTTKQLLIHIAHVQGAMTFLLLALLLYVNGGWARWLAYPVASLCLAAYETSFLPFLAAPLLLLSVEVRWSWRPWLWHGLGCAALLGGIALIRMGTGESRLAEATGNLGEALWKSFSSLYLGPWTGLRGHYLALVQGIRELGPPAFLAGSLILALFWVWLRCFARKSETKDPRLSQKALVRLAIAALLTWSLSYSLTLINYPPTQLAGRTTSTHVAAAWPVALLLGLLVEGTLRTMPKLRTGLVFLLLLTCVLLLSKGIAVQGAYVRSWDLQKAFWRQVLDLTPDAEPGCAIIVVGSLPKKGSTIIHANSWADYHACRLLFGWTRSADQQVSFGHHGILGDKLGLRLLEDGIAWTPAFWTKAEEKVPFDRLILLASDNGKLSRVRLVQVGALQLQTTRPIPAPQPHTEPRNGLFRQLFANDRP